ncbi:MAG: aminoacyl-tRNA hydrolase [Patescibacteria group bacterium]|nr:aminoacyl-tRNA hydrolase [Patescibacteria group bacterium]
MKIVVGLGNPGKKYEHTRHNAGFLILDGIVNVLQVDPRWEKKFDAEILSSGKDLFVKPYAFMNDSGKAVKAICDFYKLDATKALLVIHDDTDLPLGTVRTTESSSAAGHNGVQSIIDKLGTQDFYRIRIGVETRASRDVLPTEDFVLHPFTDAEMTKLRKDSFPQAMLTVSRFIEA